MDFPWKNGIFSGQKPGRSLRRRMEGLRAGISALAICGGIPYNKEKLSKGSRFMKYDFTSILDRRGKDAIAIEMVGAPDSPYPAPAKRSRTSSSFVGASHFSTVPTISSFNFPFTWMKSPGR